MESFLMSKHVSEIKHELKQDPHKAIKSAPCPVTIADAFSKVRCFNGRTPETTDEAMQGASALLSEYRDGGIYVTHYSGFSEWERHSKGDEFVHVLEGETCLILLLDGTEQRHLLLSGQMMVVPQGIWHRFESPKGLKVMTITPQPTEHSISHPNDI